MEKKIDLNCTRMVQAISNKSWKQHLTKEQMYSHLPPISKTNPNKMNKTCEKQR